MNKSESEPYYYKFFEKNFMPEKIIIEDGHELKFYDRKESTIIREINGSETIKKENHVLYKNTVDMFYFTESYNPAYRKNVLTLDFVISNYFKNDSN